MLVTEGGKNETKGEKKKKLDAFFFCLVNHSKDFFSTCWIQKGSLISQLLGDLSLDVGVCAGA